MNVVSATLARPVKGREYTVAIKISNNIIVCGPPFQVHFIDFSNYSIPPLQAIFLQFIWIAAKNNVKKITQKRPKLNTEEA